MHLNAFCDHAPVKEFGTRTDLASVMYRKSRQIFRIMKLVAFLLIIALHLNAKGFTQITLSEKNAPLEKIFKGIESQSGYVFFYDYSWLQQAKPVNIKVRKAPLPEVLDVCFRDQPLTYTIVGKTIVVKLREDVAKEKFAVQQLVHADITISGTVTDVVTGTALSGASVKLKGSERGTSTNANGEFTLQVPGMGSVIVISYVGYDTKEITVTGEGQIRITLQQRETKIEEIVVIGYGSRLKRDVTGAVSTINAKEIEKSTALSPELAMQGQMAGVDVSSAGGNPTARPTVRIRGVTSFNNADPLYVIDGVPFYEGGAGAVVDPTNDPTRRGPINIYTIVNPNDIESISVLKDASAASVYGIRAANGVILITTKQGRKGRVRVDFDGQFGTQEVPETYKVLNTQEYVKFYTDVYNANPDKTSGGVVVPIDQAEFFGPMWIPANPDYIGNRQTYDWQDAVINHDSRIQNYNIRASGASENTSYNFSVGYADNDGPFFGYNAKRYSIATNVISRIGKYFEAGINLRGIQTRTKDPNASVSLDIWKAAPWQMIYDPNGPYGFAPLWKLNAPITPTTFNTSTLYAQQYVAYRNVFGDLATTDSKSENQTGMGSGYLQINPVKGLRIKGSLSAQQTTITTTTWRDFNNWWFGENPENPFTPVRSPIAGTEPGLIDYGTNVSTNITKAINVDYLRSFGGHNVNITLDASQQEYKWTSNGGSSTILTRDPTLRFFSPGPNNNGAYLESRGAWALIGYLARVSYNFNNRYYADAVIRRDGSSRFAPGNQWGTFPSGSIAWRISQESFMQPLKFISELKLRIGYGVLGNENTTAGWKYLSTAGATLPSYGTGTPTTNNLGISFNTFPNEPLTWEKVYSANIGFDALLFDNTLSLSIDYYNRKTKGIIQSVSLAPTTGYSGAADLNIAKVLNRGFEFQVGYNRRFGEIITSLTANFTTVHNEVLSLLNNTALRSAGLEVGKPIGFIYGYKVGGIFQDDAEIAKWKLANNDPASLQQKPGDIYFMDLYGAPTAGSTARNPVKDGVINANDQDYLGKTIPGYYYGFTATADYKGFDISIFFQGKGDVQKYNLTRASGEGMGGYGRNVFRTVLNSWTPSNRSTTLPRAVYGDPNRNNRFSDRFVEDAGFLRLQNIQLGYDLPQKWNELTKGVIQNFRVYVTGINLFTITDYSGPDPESDLFPSTRQFLAGIKASF
jgi:TonB-dependent starch-binding outer membrane protein SusC